MVLHHVPQRAGAVVVAGAAADPEVLTGTVFQQYSFNAGPLAHSLPAMTIFEPIVAFGLGYMVLGEKFLIDTAVGWAIMLIALTVMVLSTIVLSRSPVSQRG